MNRAALHWGLSACIPHAGKTVSLERGYVYATDGYTTGIARVAQECVYAALSLGEARDLARFVKPTRKAHEVEDVDMLVNGNELHVAYYGESAVFDMCEQDVTLNALYGLLTALYAMPTDSRELMFQPSFGARFAKAQRVETDILRVYPRLTHRPVDRGVALVTVGADFIGAIAGLAHDDAPTLLADFLQNAREEAA